MGLRDGESKAIESSQNSSAKEALHVLAEVEGVADVDLNELNDEVAAFGGVDGSETANAATRQIINVDSSGRVRVNVPDGQDAALGATTDTTAADTVIGRLKNLLSRWPSALGQRTKADSLSVTFASDADTVPVDTELPAATALADNTANPTIPAVAGYGMVFDGTTWDRQPGTSTDGTLVNLGANNDVIQATASNLNAQTVGNIAHDGVDSGNPLKVGGRAVAHGANPTAVAAADRTNLYATRHGILFVHNGHPNMQRAEYTWTTAQTNDDVLGAIATGTKYVVCGYNVTSDEAGTTGLKFRLGFGATAVPTEPTDGNSVTGMIASHSGMIPGGGIVERNLYLPGGDGEEVRLTAEAPTSGTAKLLIDYFTIES